MRKDDLLIVLAAAGSALCWWPFFMMQLPDRSPLWFAPYPLIALVAGCCAFLSGGRWLRFAVVSSVSTFVGIFIGRAIWPDEDGIAQSFLLYGAGLATLIVALVSSLAGLVGRLLSKR
jgi:hypothetical protein